MRNNAQFGSKSFRYVILGFSLLLVAAIFYARPIVGAEGDADNVVSPSEVDPGTAASSTDAADEEKPAEDEEGLNLFKLFVDSGWFFMVPILLVSCGVVAIAIERFIGLQRNKVIPAELVVSLGQLGGGQGGFDPRRAYRLCQQFPSAALTVIRAMLLKVGRPHSEVEHAVTESSEREADRLFTNVRWLVLAAAVAPLWGLLGTVWGMIMAFHDTSLLRPGQNKAEMLAEGIYTALVTTLCGLFIAIPSAILAHYFEGRITSLFHQIDELLFNLLPQVERYEGRVRFNRQMGDEEAAAPQRPADTRVAAPPAAAPK